MEPAGRTAVHSRPPAGSQTAHRGCACSRTAASARTRIPPAPTRSNASPRAVSACTSPPTPAAGPNPLTWYSGPAGPDTERATSRIERPSSDRRHHSESGSDGRPADPCKVHDAHQQHGDRSGEVDKYAVRLPGRDDLSTAGPVTRVLLVRLSPSVSACTSKHFQRAPRQLVDDLLIGAVVTLAVDQGVVHPRRARSSCADPRQCKPSLHRILPASGHLAACHHGPGPESAEYDKHRRRRTSGTHRVRLRGRPNKSLNRGERQLAIAATSHPHADERASCISVIS
jgi:hypothetical protein